MLLVENSHGIDEDPWMEKRHEFKQGWNLYLIFSYSELETNKYVFKFEDHPELTNLSFTGALTDIPVSVAMHK